MVLRPEVVFERFVVKRLTAATLPAAETAPTARVDCRRAWRNILQETDEDKNKRNTIAAGVQLVRGEIGGGVGYSAAFAGEQIGVFRERTLRKGPEREESSAGRGRGQRLPEANRQAEPWNCGAAVQFARLADASQLTGPLALFCLHFRLARLNVFPLRQRTPS